MWNLEQDYPTPDGKQIPFANKPAFPAIIGCQLDLIILFNNAFSGILREGISQNITLRVFLKLQETLK